MSDALNFARALIGQGLGASWGDEAEAWLRSKISGRPYEEERSDINRSYGEFSKRYPISSAATEFAGGVIPAVAAYAATPFTGGAAAPAAAATTARTAGALSTLANRIAASKAARTTAGGAAGAGAGYLSDEELATENAIMGGGLGLVAGAQGPRIARLARTPYGRGATVGGVQGGISGAGAAEPGARVEEGKAGALVGTSLGVALPLAMRGAGAAKRWWSERFSPSEEAITRGAASRINRELQEAGMTPADIETRLAADRAMGVPSVAANIDPALADLAETVAQRSGQGGREVRGVLEGQQRGTRERVYERARTGLNAGDAYADEENLIKALRGRANTQYDEAYAFGAVNDPRIMSVLQDREFMAAYVRAREIANREARAAELRGEDPSKYMLRQIYSVDPTTNGVRVTAVPDVRTLDYIKRGIDSIIESGFNGKGLSRTEARSLRDLRSEYIKAIDEATTVDGRSAYQAARQSFAGDMEVKDALRAGMDNFNKLDHEEIGRLFRGMSDAEKQAFRTGAARNIYGTIMDPSSNINAAQRLIGSPEMQQKLSTIFESPAQFDLFKAALTRESELFHQANRILQGSPTARRMQARERFEEGPDVGAVAADLATGGWAASLTNMVSRAVRGANMNDEIAGRVAGLLMSREPTEVAAAVKILEDYGQRAARAERALSRTEAGTIGGTVSAMWPSPRSSADAIAEPENPAEMSRPATTPRMPSPTYREEAESELDRGVMPEEVLIAPRRMMP
jgi:hypothetical protein